MLAVVFFYVFAMPFVFAADWKQESAELTRGDFYQAIGFYDGRITIIGGWNHEQQRVVFDTTTNSITDNQQNAPDITINIECLSQGWIQNNEILYIIPAVGTHFVLYDLANNNMIEWTQSHRVFTKTVLNVGCLEYWDNYLFVIGGWDGSNVYDTTQIFNISGDQWLIIEPTMNVKRESLSCIIHPNRQRLYAFGGHDGSDALSSIEFLAVNDMENIGEWTLNPIDLLQKHYQSRAVVFEDNIILIGGEYDDGSVQHIQQEQIFNTITNQTVWGKMMMVELAAAATIYVSSENNSILTFGGYAGVDGLKTIQSRSLGPTSSPTSIPTTYPTINPTFHPTSIPSSTPTAPSNDPTEFPSTYPTYNPTYYPTQPTINPTIYSTSTAFQSTTSNPASISTSNPSIYPTMEPTIEPSLETTTFNQSIYSTSISTSISTLNPSVVFPEMISTELSSISNAENNDLLSVILPILIGTVCCMILLFIVSLGLFQRNKKTKRQLTELNNKMAMTQLTQNTNNINNKNITQMEQQQVAVNTKNEDDDKDESMYKSYPMRVTSEPAENNEESGDSERLYDEFIEIAEQKETKKGDDAEELYVAQPQQTTTSNQQEEGF